MYATLNSWPIILNLCRIKMYLNICLIIVSLSVAVSGHQSHDDNFFQPDIQHIKEDVKEQYHINIDEKTSESELDWYYFRMHDFDNNMVLDGLEILTAMNHVIDESSLKAREETTPSPPKTIDDEDNVDPMEFFNIRERYRTQLRWNEKFETDSKTIDKLFKDYDKDNDGFISYSEYILARRDTQNG